MKTEGLLRELIGDGRPALSLTAVALLLAGAFAIFLSFRREFLPHARSCRPPGWQLADIRLQPAASGAIVKHRGGSAALAGSIYAQGMLRGSSSLARAARQCHWAMNVATPICGCGVSTSSSSHSTKYPGDFE
jgi:hypothetical protein